MDMIRRDHGTTGSIGRGVLGVALYVAAVAAYLSCWDSDLATLEGGPSTVGYLIGRSVTAGLVGALTATLVGLALSPCGGRGVVAPIGGPVLTRVLDAVTGGIAAGAIEGATTPFNRWCLGAFVGGTFVGAITGLLVAGVVAAIAALWYVGRGYLHRAIAAR